MAGPARIVAFGMGLCGALVTSQAPEFAQQYRQRLGGAIDELARVTERFEEDARSTGRTRDEAIARLRGESDELVRRQGAAMQDVVARLDRLKGQQQAMAAAGTFGRLASLVQHADPGIAGAAYRDFEPAMPVTAEGGVAALAGFGTAWGVTLLLIKGLGRLFRRRRPARVAYSAAGLPDRRT